jgi:hypothetical protein
VTEEQTAFIKDLKLSPVWGEILEQISYPVPRFHPDKQRNWEYESGRSFEAERIRKLLGG